MFVTGRYKYAVGGGGVLQNKRSPASILSPPPPPCPPCPPVPVPQGAAGPPGEGLAAELRSGEHGGAASAALSGRRPRAEEGKKTENWKKKWTISPNVMVRV